MSTLRPAPAIGPTRVLVIDPDTAFVDLLSSILEHESGGEFVLTPIGTLAEARTTLALRRHDVVLVDLNLPDSDGIDTLRGLLAESALPVVVMTAADDTLLAHRAMKAGAQAFLLKGEDQGRHVVRALQYAVERHRAAERLARSEQRFRDFAEIACDWFSETDPTHRIAWVSERLRDLMNIDPGSFIGRSWVDLLAPDEDGDKIADYLQHLERREPYRNFIVRLAAAPDRRLRLSGKPVYSRSGKFLGYRSVSTDVTEELESAQFAGRMLSILTDSIASFPGGVMIFDGDDRLLLANDRAFSLLPVSGDAFVPGTTFLEILRIAAGQGFFTAAQGRIDDWLAGWRTEKLHTELPVCEPTRQSLPLYIHQYRTGTGGTLRYLRPARKESAAGARSQ
jgi:PAS domain S-box-containing protein